MERQNDSGSTLTNNARIAENDVSIIFLPIASLKDASLRLLFRLRVEFTEAKFDIKDIIKLINSSIANYRNDNANLIDILS